MGMVQGTVLSIREEAARTSTTAAALTGVSVLPVDAAFGFSGTGGELRLDWSDETTESTLTVDYLTVDYDLHTITLVAPLGVDVPAAAEVVNPSNVRRIAEVQTDVDTEPTQAVVHHSLLWSSVMQVGDYTETANGARVVVEDIMGQPTVTSIIGGPAARLDEAVGADVIIGVPSLPPADAPIVTVEDMGVGAVMPEWAAVDGAQYYEVAASLTPGFDPNTDIEVTGITGLRTIVSRVDGAMLPMNGDLTYVRVRAVNVVDAGPWSAEVSAAARQADAEYLSALYGWFNSIEAQSAIIGELNVVMALGVDGVISIGQRITIADPESPGSDDGITIWGDDEHTIILARFSPHGNYLDAQLIANEISILDSLRLIGTASALAANGVFTLEAGTVDPPAPTLSASALAFVSAVPPTGYVVRGMCYDTATNTYRQLIFKASTSEMKVRTINASTGAVTGTMTLDNAYNATFKYVNSLILLGGNYYSWVGVVISDGVFEDEWRLQMWDAGLGFQLANYYHFTDDMADTDHNPIVFTDGTSVYYTTATYGRIAKAITNLSTTSGQTYADLAGSVTDDLWRKLDSGHIGVVEAGGSNLMSLHSALTGLVITHTMASFSSTPGAVTLTRQTSKEWLTSTAAQPICYNSEGRQLRTVNNKALTSNVATLGTTVAHGLVVGQDVWVSGVGAPFDGQQTVTAIPDSTHFSFAKTNANITSVASGGNYSTDGGFYGTDNTANIKWYSSYFPSGSEKWWAQSADIAGALHTNMSPESLGLTVAARQFVTVTLSTLPMGVTDSEVWVGYGTTTPGATKKKRTELVVGRVMPLVAGKITGTDAMYSTNTAGGSPSVIQAELGEFEVHGDSSGKWPEMREVAPIGGTLTPTSGTPFTIVSEELTRVGFVVFANMVVTRASSFSTSFLNVADIPAGFRPIAGKSIPTSVQALGGGATYYRFQVTTTNIQLGMNQAAVNAMIIDTWWITADAFP